MRVSLFAIYPAIVGCHRIGVLICVRRTAILGPAQRRSGESDGCGGPAAVPGAGQRAGGVAGGGVSAGGVVPAAGGVTLLSVAGGVAAGAGAGAGVTTSGVGGVSTSFFWHPVTAAAVSINAQANLAVTWSCFMAVSLWEGSSLMLAIPEFACHRRACSARVGLVRGSRNTRVRIETTSPPGRGRPCWRSSSPVRFSAARSSRQISSRRAPA